MDWGKLTKDVSAWGDKVVSKLGEAADQAQAKIEEAKLRTQPPITVGPHRVVRLKKLADGGFSEVFLARAADGEELFALKRMVCQTPSAKADAKAELKVLKMMSSHPNHINILGASAQGVTVPGQRQESMEVNFLFPFYKRGTVFDAMWGALEQQRALSSGVGGSGGMGGGGSGGMGGFGGGGGARGFGSGSAWPFPERELLLVLLGVAKGLDAMHEKGFAHRDVKPHNVLLSGNGTPVLMDLGSAELGFRDVATRQEAAKVEDDAGVKCSAPYRSPELTEVRYPCSLTPVVDVWSLGCCAYAMAFDAFSPFESELEGVKRLAILNGKYLLPPGRRNRLGCAYSEGFAALLGRLLTLDPASRPTMNEARRLIAAVGRGEPLPDLPPLRTTGGGEEGAPAARSRDMSGASAGASLRPPTAASAAPKPALRPPSPTPLPPPPPDLLDFDAFPAAAAPAAAAAPEPGGALGAAVGGSGLDAAFCGMGLGPEPDFGDFASIPLAQQPPPGGAGDFGEFFAAPPAAAANPFGTPAAASSPFDTPAAENPFGQTATQPAQLARPMACPMASSFGHSPGNFVPDPFADAAPEAARPSKSPGLDAINPFEGM